MTDEKLSFYRLDGTDMAFYEETQLHIAARFGMTRQEYMQKKALVDEDVKVCVALATSESERRRDEKFDGPKRDLVDQYFGPQGEGRRDDKFDGLKCIDDAHMKYGLHGSQRKRGR